VGGLGDAKGIYKFATIKKTSANFGDYPSTSEGKA